VDKERVPTKPVTIRWIMSDPAFERGVRDARARRAFPRNFNHLGDQLNLEL
jgi:hypothetical protein